ncbi:MAG TPA: Calx-beta domain-containing protein, partial [Thermoanaerobaculia bacterium]|nr:Calx-beta domain-containing protein [Thermoanaerobaculia bacterium]
TIGDTATAGEDFTPFANIFTIPPDQFSATITVPIAQDAKAEGTETFALELSQPWNTVLKTTVVRARIDDDDDPDTPLINVQDAASSERSGFVRFTVSLNQPAVTRTTIHYGTRDGSAKAGQDYSAALGVLTFEPGESAKTVDVAVAMDKEVESNETFVFRLGNGLTATGTITDSNLTTRTRSVRH